MKHTSGEVEKGKKSLWDKCRESARPQKKTAIGVKISPKKVHTKKSRNRGGHYRKATKQYKLLGIRAEKG